MHIHLLDFILDVAVHQLMHIAYLEKNTFGGYNMKYLCLSTAALQAFAFMLSPGDCYRLLLVVLLLVLQKDVEKSEVSK